MRTMQSHCFGVTKDPHHRLSEDPSHVLSKYKYSSESGRKMEKQTFLNLDEFNS